MTQIRLCKKCGREKLLLDFDFYDKSKGARRHECRACHRNRMNAWFLANKEVAKRNSAERYKRNPSSQWTEEKKARAYAHSKRYTRETREIVMAHYGGKCACCGESTPGFLTLDHIDNDGGKMRKIHGVGLSLYRWIMKNNYPSNFRVLCYNCNCGRALNDGICPHQSQGRLNDYPEREYAASDWQRKRPEPISQ